MKHTEQELERLRKLSEDITTSKRKYVKDLETYAKVSFISNQDAKGGMENYEVEAVYRGEDCDIAELFIVKREKETKENTVYKLLIDTTTWKLSITKDL